MKTSEILILEVVRSLQLAQSSDIHAELHKRREDISLVTVKRSLSQLSKKRFLHISGSGPSTAYALSEYGKLMSEVNAEAYCNQEPDSRIGSHSYNFQLFGAINFNPFTTQEKRILDDATTFYRRKILGVSKTIHSKELERFVIELSWKSSRIEGNTYTLLDTERLILHGVEAPGHSREEAAMILNHKEVFQYIYRYKNQFKTINRSKVEDIHKILVKNLRVKTNLRSSPVGVTGSIYRPLDNEHQIKEGLNQLTEAVNRVSSGYAKALVALLGISYVQPFEDGNKRTARLIANAILLAHKLSPLSYRNVSEKKYREAMLVFYELNSLVPFKQIFVEQYNFAARNYLAS